MSIASGHHTSGRIKLSTGRSCDVERASGEKENIVLPNPTHSHTKIKSVFGKTLKKKRKQPRKKTEQGQRKAQLLKRVPSRFPVEEEGFEKVHSFRRGPSGSQGFPDSQAGRGGLSGSEHKPSPVLASRGLPRSSGMWQ